MQTSILGKQRFLFLACLPFILLPAITFAQTCIAQRFANSTATIPLQSWATSTCVLPLVCTITSNPVDAATATTTAGIVVKVTGTCGTASFPENVTRMTVDGQGSAVLVGDGLGATVSVTGTGITIRNFASIRGGTNGINVNRGGTAVIVNNTIENNSLRGIQLADGATARIGVLANNDIVPSPNIIQNNGDSGIEIQRSSSARIVGNIVINNTLAGISVTRVSQADIASNTLNGNGTDGIFVTENSGVTLGNDSGTTIYDLPNITTTNNTGFGIRCATNSSADGRLGSVNGIGGPKSFASNCTDSTIP